MLVMLATGHPAIPTGGDLDFTPLLYTGLLLLLLLRARVPLRIWVFPLVLLAGGLIDSISDGLGLSTPMTASVVLLMALFTPARRAATPPLGPPDV